MLTVSTFRRRSLWVPAFALVSLTGCDVSCPIEPASPVVSADSEAAQKARAEDEALRQERQQQESRVRAKGKARRLPLGG